MRAEEREEPAGERRIIEVRFVNSRELLCTAFDEQKDFQGWFSYVGNMDGDERIRGIPRASRQRKEQRQPIHSLRPTHYGPARSHLRSAVSDTGTVRKVKPLEMWRVLKACARWAGKGIGLKADQVCAVMTAAGRAYNDELKTPFQRLIVIRLGWSSALRPIHCGRRRLDVKFCPDKSTCEIHYMSNWAHFWGTL